MLRRSNSARLKERRLLTLDDLAAKGPLRRRRSHGLRADLVRERVSENGKPSADKIEAEQHAAHGLAWLATYVEAIKEMAAYARRMQDEGRFGKTEQLLTRIGLGEYLAQVFSAIPMNQGEMARLADFGLEPQEIAPFRNEAVEALIAGGDTRENRAALAALMREARQGAIGDPGLDETFEAIRGEMRRFADAEIVPHAQSWHRANAYIPARGDRRPSAPWAFSASLSPRLMAAWVSARRRCASSRRSCRAAISALAPSGRGPRSPPSSSWSAARRRRNRNTCPRSRAAKSCRPRFSPSPTPARTSRSFAPARPATATTMWSAGPRPGSPIRFART